MRQSAQFAGEYPTAALECAESTALEVALFLIPGPADDALIKGNRIRRGLQTVDNATDFASSTGRLSGKLWGDENIPKLRKFLQKRGVTLLENQDSLLTQMARQRGYNDADAAFMVHKNGNAYILLRKNPTRREVLHELAHCLHRQKVTPEVYKTLSTSQKETWVGNFLRNSKEWDNLTAEEQWRELENILKHGESLQ
jgi:hypothetical protein